MICQRLILPQLFHTLTEIVQHVIHLSQVGLRPVYAALKEFSKNQLCCTWFLPKQLMTLHLFMMFNTPNSMVKWLQHCAHPIFMERTKGCRKNSVNKGCQLQKQSVKSVRCGSVCNIMWCIFYHDIILSHVWTLFYPKNTGLNAMQCMFGFASWLRPGQPRPPPHPTHPLSIPTAHTHWISRSTLKMWKIIWVCALLQLLNGDVGSNDR